MAINMDGTTYDSVDEFFEVMDGMYERGMVKIDDMPDPDKFREYLAEKESPKDAEDGGEKIAREIQEELHGDFVKRVEKLFYKLSEDPGVDTGYVYEYAPDEPSIKAGDKVRIVGNRELHMPFDTIRHNFEIGDVGVVIKTDSGGDVLVAVKGSDYASQTISPEHVEIVEPTAQDANGEDLYEGDLVTGINDDVYFFTDSKALMEAAEDGNPHRDGEIKVSVVKHVNEKFDGLTAIVNPEYFVKTTEEEYYKTHNPVIEVGSKVIALKDGCDITEGVVYTVEGIDTDGDYSFMDDETETNYFNHEDNGITFRLATDEEIADAEREESGIKFKVGDKVRVIGETKTHYHRIEDVGEVVTVAEISRAFDGSQNYVVSVEGHTQHHVGKDLEPISDSKDFQDGDIVYVNEEFTDATSDTAKIGFAEVSDPTVSGTQYVLQNGKRIISYNHHYTKGEGDYRDNLTLVCRAEDRLDK